MRVQRLNSICHVAYTDCEDDAAYVSGPLGTRLVVHNGNDYSVLSFQPLYSAWSGCDLEHGTRAECLAEAKRLTGWGKP